MGQLTQQGLVPENLRADVHVDDYDLFAVLAAVNPRQKATGRQGTVDFVFCYRGRFCVNELIDATAGQFLMNFSDENPHD